MIYKCAVGALGLWTLIIHADCSSHTVFIPRSITHDATYELALSNYEFYHASAKKLCNLYLTPFYQQSFHAHKTAPYFLLNGKQCIHFAQDGSGDVNPIWLNLISGLHGENYSSSISVRPELKVFGLHIAFFFNFDEQVKGLWMEVATAPMGCSQSLHLCETNIQENTDTLIPGIANGIDALTNPELQYGKFTRCSLKKGGLDDIQIKLGWNRFFCDGENHIGPYFLLSLPTGSQPHNRVVFEPRVGTHNAALGFGYNADYAFWRNDCNTLHFMSDLKYRYLFKNHECRSFDLCSGPWTRYLQVVSPDQTSDPMPGINVCLTQKAGVTPRSQIEWWNALHWATDVCHVEIGWNLWCRQSEKVTPRCCSCPYGVYDLGADAQRQNARHLQVRQPLSASNGMINQSVFPPHAVPSDPEFVTIESFNSKSAGHPTALSNKVYIATAYDTSCCTHPMFFGIGSSVEIGHKNAAFSYWALWGKFGLSF